MKIINTLFSLFDNSNRIHWIDNMKALGMVLVVLGHVTTNKTYLGYIYAFHMPLFFFVGGYILSRSTVQLNIVKRIRTVLVPYLSFAVLFFIYWAFFERYFRDQTDISLRVPLLNIVIAKVTEHGYVQNVVLWFLPCYFVSTVLFVLIHKTVQHDWLRLMLVSLLGALGIFYSSLLEQRPPWMLDSAMVSLLFVAAGFYFSKIWKTGFSMALKWRLLLGTVCLVGLFVASSFNEFTSIAYNEYGNPLLFLSAALFGILGIFFLSHFKNKVSSFIGVYSLILMCIHDPLKRIVLKIMMKGLGIDSNTLKQSLGYSLLGTFLIIAISIPLMYLLNRYLGFLMGQSFLKKSVVKSEN